MITPPDMQRTPWVRVVIVNYNAGPWLQRTVDALAAQSLEEFEAVILDNASKDASFRDLRLPDSRFRLLNAGFNVGFAAGCNLGAWGSRTPWLAMLNPDAMPRTDWLERLRDAMRRHPECVCFGSRQLMALSPDTLDGAGDNYSIYGLAWRGGHGHPDGPDRDRPVASACAAAALYRRDAFEAAGGFAEHFFCYLEDVDLGLRLRLAGHEVIQLADAVVLHVGSACSGQESPLARRLGTRNGIWLMLRCLPLPLLLAALPLHLLAQAWLMVRRPHSLPPRLAGFLQALPGLASAWKQGRHIQKGRRVSLGTVAGWLAYGPRPVMGRSVMSLHTVGDGP